MRAVLGIALLGLLVAGTARAQDPFSLYADLPPDSTEARGDVIAADPPAFVAAFDSVLVAGEATGILLESAALDYLSATGDSLLLSDLRFVEGASAETAALWYEAVQTDARGLALRKAGDTEGAIDALTAAATAYRELGDLRREAVCWGSLGVAWWATGDWDQVHAAYENALVARERLGDPVLLGRTLNGLGTVCFQQGRYQEALRYYTLARDVRETLGNPIDLAVTTTYLGNVQMRLGKLDEARIQYGRALELLGPDAPPRRLNETRNSLALALDLLGRPEEAAEIHRQVLASATEAGDIGMEAISRNNLANELLVLGEPGEALRTLAPVQDMDGLPSYVLLQTYSIMGYAYLRLGDPTRALEILSEARDVANETGDQLEGLHLLLQTGVVYQNMNLASRALAAYEEAQARADSLGLLEEGRNARFSRAGLLETQGDAEAALALIDEVIASDREDGFEPYLAADYVNRGNTLAGLGRRVEAMAAYREGTALAARIDLKDELWKGYLGIGDTFEQEGQLDSARVYNDLAIGILEEMGSPELTEETKTALVAKRAFVYEAQVNVLAQLAVADPGEGFAAEAFSVAEQGKARALLDLLSEGHVDLEAGFTPALGAERDSLDRAIRSARYQLRLAVEEGASSDSVRVLKGEIRDRERRRDELEERMRLENPRFAALDTGKPAGLEQVRSTLLSSGNDVLLEYSLGDSASYLWVVTQEGLSLLELPPRPEVEAATGALRAALRNPDPSGDEALVASSSALGEMILAPVLGKLKKADTIYVVPDGTLHFVPFEVLLDTAPPVPAPEASPEERARFLRDLPYALGDKQVVYGPSATTLALLVEGREERREQEPVMEFLGVGDPAFTPSDRAADEPLRGGDLAPLPYTRDEVETIAAEFPSGSATVLVGEAASEATIGQPGYLDSYRVIHFATHGLVDERHPERSSLALAFPRDPSEDGYLQASEIYRLHLNADLVVLSACETALGRMVRGEGVLGLPRAFLYAGASSVVVSLWSVSDRSTSELMRAFYEEMVGEGMGAGRALARAKESLRSTGTFAHPFYWAPFVLIGPA